MNKTAKKTVGIFVAIALLALTILSLSLTLNRSPAPTQLSAVPSSGGSGTIPGDTDLWINNKSSNLYDGTGTKEDPYLVDYAGELAYIAYECYTKSVSYYIKQTKDIDMSQYYWIPLGVEAFPFMGHYDGGGFKITGLKFKTGTESAFFGYVRGSTANNVKAELKNINCNASLAQKVELSNVANCNSEIQRFVKLNPAATPDRNKGGLIAYAIDTEISNCKVKLAPGFGAGPDSNIYYYGVIVGYLERGKILSCSNNNGGYSINVFDQGGSSGLGGIVGGCEADVTIENCTNNIDLYAERVGGIVCGISFPDSNTINRTGIIKNCKNYGNINGDINQVARSGGIVGGTGGLYYCDFEISNCTNYGNNFMAGIICDAATDKDSPDAVINIKKCINKGEISSIGNAGGIISLCPGRTPVYLESCINEGDITVNSTTGRCTVGGIAGTINGGISNCINTGKITVNSSGSLITIGGIVGDVASLKTCEIKNNYLAPSCVIDISITPGTSQSQTASLGMFVGQYTFFFPDSAASAFGTTPGFKVQNNFSLASLNVNSTFAGTKQGLLIGGFDKTYIETATVAELVNFSNLYYDANKSNISTLIGEGQDMPIISNCQSKTTLEADMQVKTNFESGNSFWTNPWDFENTWAFTNDELFPQLRFAKPNWISYCPTSINGTDVSGTGTEADPLIIHTELGLAYLSWVFQTNARLDAAGIDKKIFVSLGRDLDMSAHDWTPIGDIDEVAMDKFELEKENQGLGHLTTEEMLSFCAYFGGNFNGNGFSISNLKADQAAAGYNTPDKGQGLALFSALGDVDTFATSGQITPGATVIENLTINNVSNFDSLNMGTAGLALGAYGVTVKNVSVTGTIDTVSPILSGFIVQTTSVDFIDCENHANITDKGEDTNGLSIAGFVIRSMLNTNFIDCKNYGNITSDKKRGSIAGIVSDMHESGSIVGCENHGNIVGRLSDQVSGIACEVHPQVLLKDNKNYGDISGYFYISGVLTKLYDTDKTGFTGSAIISNCENAGQINILFNSSISTMIYVGGVVAENAHGGLVKFENCINSGKIQGLNFEGGAYCGGILSFANQTTGEIIFENCHNTSNIEFNIASDRNMSPGGGIASLLTTPKLTFQNCTNRGNIGGGMSAGIIYGAMSNVEITNSKNYGDMTGGYAAGIISAVYGSFKIENCSNYGDINPWFHSGAGILFNADHCSGTIRHCYNSGTVHGAGGIAGLIMESTGRIEISDCVNVGNLSAGYLGSGGIVAEFRSTNDFSISRCISTGNMTADLIGTGSANDTGGIIARVHGSTGTITDCYAAGTLTSKENIAGIVGHIDQWGSATIKNCVFSGSITAVHDGTYSSSLWANVVSGGTLTASDLIFKGSYSSLQPVSTGGFFSDIQSEVNSSIVLADLTFSDNSFYEDFYVGDASSFSNSVWAIDLKGGLIPRSLMWIEPFMTSPSASEITAKLPARTIGDLIMGLQPGHGGGGEL